MSTLKRDPVTRYFGAQGHWSAVIAQGYLEHASAKIKDSNIRLEFEEAVDEYAFNHDVAYEGKREKGLWGWLKNMIARHEADEKLRDDIIEWILDNQDFLCDDTFLELLEFADKVYLAIRAGGWKFYKQGKNNE